MAVGTITKEELIKLYSSGKSMWEISQSLSCSVHKITYWMTKYDIKKRSRSDAMYLKLNPNGDPFKIANNINSVDNFLFGLGLGIYWGEGNKSDKHSVRVTNTDPKIILTFQKFLRVICNVLNDKMRYSLICFNDSSPETISKHWAKLIKIPIEKFGKIVQVPPQGKGTYKHKSEFGVCSINVSNIKLKSWIIGQISKIQPN